MRLINERARDQPPLNTPFSQLPAQNTQTYDQSPQHLTRAFYDHICASYEVDMGLFPDTQCARRLAAAGVLTVLAT